MAVTSLLLLLAPVSPLAQEPEPVTLERLAPLEARLVALAEHVQAVTVGMQTGGAEGGGASASGVLVSAEGHILTVAHAFREPGRKVLVFMSDGSERVGRTLGREGRADFALVQLEEPGSFPFAEMGSSEELETGDLVMCVGHPGGVVAGRSPVVRLGTIGPQRRSFLISSAVLMPGDSGGPLFDLDGKVVGINSRIETDERMNYHVPVERYKENWERLVAGEDLTRRRGRGGGRPMFGAVLSNHRDGPGLEVQELRDGSPAVHAGMRVGDVLTHIDGERVGDRGELHAVLREYERGDRADLRVKRGEEEVVVEIRFGRWRDEEDGR